MRMREDYRMSQLKNKCRFEGSVLRKESDTSREYEVLCRITKRDCVPLGCTVNTRSSDAE